MAVTALCAVLAACSSTQRVASTQPVEHRPAESDTYPDFARPLNAAMPQMSDEEAAQQEAQLSALAVRRKSGEISESEYQARVKELRLLIPKNTSE